MIQRQVLCLLALTVSCGAAEFEDSAKNTMELFQEARRLADRNRRKLNEEALARIQSAVDQFKRAISAGEEIDRKVFGELKWAAQRIREDLHDYDASLRIGRLMLEHGIRGNPILDARLEIALTYRAMRDFKKAKQQYDAIVLADARRQKNVLLPVAEMVYFEIGDKERGRKLLDEALMTREVSGIARYRVVLNCASRAIVEGQRDEAIKWYAMIEKMPDERPRDHLRYLTRAWYEMGKIEESRGRRNRAKALYRKAMDLEGGQMTYRVRARDALEGIEYFE